MPLLVGISVSWFLARAYYRKGGMGYYVKDFDIIDLERFNLGKNISILANANAVRELRVCTVVIWNSGTIAYSKEDIARNDPLRLVRQKPGFAEVLSPNQSRLAVAAKFEQLEDAILINFDILDEGDWMTFRVVYEGDSKNEKERIKPQIVGNLLNMPKGLKSVDLEDYFTEKMWLRRISDLILAMMPIGVSLIFYKVLTLMEQIEKASGKIMPDKGAFIILGSLAVASVVIASALYQILRWILVSAKVPKQILMILK